MTETGRRSRLTIRARLTALYALLVAVSTGILLLVSYWLLGRHFDRTLPAPLANDALDEVAVQYGIAFVGVVLMAACGRLGDRRARARAAEAHHRDGAPGVRGAPRRAHRGDRPRRRAARAGGDAELDARPPGRLVRRAAPLRGQRQPRAARPADGDPLRGRGGARQPRARPGRAARHGGVGDPREPPHRGAAREPPDPRARPARARARAKPWTWPRPPARRSTPRSPSPPARACG